MCSVKKIENYSLQGWEVRPTIFNNQIVVTLKNMKIQTFINY